MMGKTPKEKEEGTRILNNYKKQLAEKLAREKATVEREGMSTHTHSYKKSSVFSGKTKGSGKSNKSGRSRSSKKLHPSSGISDVEAMEPEVLLRILYGKGSAAAASLGHTAGSLNSKKW